jgi:hypothetical protein
MKMLAQNKTKIHVGEPPKLIGEQVSTTINPHITARERMSILKEHQRKPQEGLMGPKEAHQALRQRAEAMRKLLSDTKK